VHLRTGWRFGKVSTLWKLVREVACDLGECAQTRPTHWLEDDLIAMFFDENLRANEAKCLWQPNSLAATVLEKFRSIHIYILYLLRPCVKRSKFQRPPYFMEIRKKAQHHRNATPRARQFGCKLRYERDSLSAILSTRFRSAETEALDFQVGVRPEDLPMPHPQARIRLAD